MLLSVADRCLQSFRCSAVECSLFCHLLVSCCLHSALVVCTCHYHELVITMTTVVFKQDKSVFTTISAVFKQNCALKLNCIRMWPNIVHAYCTW